MKNLRFKISLILLALSLSYSSYEIYNVKFLTKAINISSNELSSTKEWQDMVQDYLVRRNQLICEVLKGNYNSNKKWITELKQIECPPLLDGDIVLIKYMSQNPIQFPKKISNIKVEYSNIRQLTKEEVIMDTKISFTENNANRSYGYEIVLKNVDDNWRISKLTFAQ